MQLYEALARRVAAWREENYRHEEYPALAEILEWASDPDVQTTVTGAGILLVLLTFKIFLFSS